jgi:hypothetical protein
VLLSDIAEKKLTKLKITITDEHTQLRCEQLIKHKFDQCAHANLETSFLLEIDDVSPKLGCVAIASFLCSSKSELHKIPARVQCTGQCADWIDEPAPPTIP